MLVLVALVAMGTGAVCGGLVVFSLFMTRKKILASSLTHDHALAGCIGRVQVPFDYRSKGKIRISRHHSTQEITALTDYPNAFSQGDRVLIIQVVDSHAWVVPGDMTGNG